MKHLADCVEGEAAHGLDAAELEFQVWSYRCIRRYLERRSPTDLGKAHVIELALRVCRGGV